MIKVTRVKTNGKAAATGPYMHQMVNQYYNDMLPWADLTLPEIYDKIKNIPYRPDPPEEETLMRPAYTMSMAGWGGDCDDKAIALASWCRLHGMPYRFVAVRRFDRPMFHHVFSEVLIGNQWINADCTYSVNALGIPRESYAERLIL